MTLRDLWLVIRHYVKWVVIVPILCALLAGGVMLAKESTKGESYTAKATLTVTDPSGMLNSVNLSNLANAVAQNVVSLNADANASAKADATAQSIDFTASGSNAEEAVNSVNAITHEAADSIQEALAQQGASYWDTVSEANSLGISDQDPIVGAGATPADRVAALQSCVFTVAEATSASGSGSSSVVKYAAVGLLGGLFAIICILALMDSGRRPLKTKEDVVACVDVPVLVDGSSVQNGERLWANVQFAADDAPVSSVSIVPVSSVDVRPLCEALKMAMQSRLPQTRIVAVTGDDNATVESTEDSADAVILKCAPLTEGMAAAYASRSAQTTVVVVRAWRDTQAKLCDVLAELKLARANVVGVAFVD